jgi:hypothetical protein
MSYYVGEYPHLSAFLFVYTQRDYQTDKFRHYFCPTNVSFLKGYCLRLEKKNCRKRVDYFCMSQTLAKTNSIVINIKDKKLITLCKHRCLMVVVRIHVFFLSKQIVTFSFVIYFFIGTIVQVFLTF